MSSEHDVFQWLGNDSSGLPYYLQPLNLCWSDEGPEVDLARFKEVAARLRMVPEYLSRIIRERNWRPTLVGCVCLLVSGERGFAADLLHTFERGSMVEPQIAVTLGILHPSEAQSFFEVFISRSTSRLRPRALLSAQTVLQCLGVFKEANLSLDGWTELERDGAILGNYSTLKQWAFWSTYEKRTPQ
jgi:hypothetical protein